MTSINVNNIPSPWGTSPLGAGGGALGVSRTGSTSAGALGGFQLPDSVSAKDVVTFAKPILSGALGVDIDKLGGESPFALVAGLVSLTRTQSAEGKRDVLGSAKDARTGNVQNGVQSATDNYDIDVGQAVLNWASDPKNLEQGFKFATQVVQTVAGAIASGGASLATDLPALASSGLMVADDILKASGLSAEQVLGKAATDVLTAMGMDPSDAAKLGPFIASAGIAGVQVYNAVQSGDLSGLDPKTFINLAKNGAVLMGADRDTVNTVASAATGAASFADAFLNGRSDLMNSGNLSGLLDSGSALGKAAEAFIGGRNVDVNAVVSEGKNFLNLLGGVMRDVERDTQIPGLADNIGNRFNTLMGDVFQDLGPFGPIAKMAMDSVLQNGFGQRTTV